MDIVNNLAFLASHFDRVCYAIIKNMWSYQHPLCGALPVPFVPVRVTRGVLDSQYRRIFIPISVSLGNDLADPVFDGVGLAGFTCRANAFLLA